MLGSLPRAVKTGPMDWGCRAEWRSTWHVLGCRRSVREWALRQGWGGRLVRQEQAQGMLVAALGLLAAHYRLDDRPGAHMPGLEARLGIGA
jgi:hypothetical protein